MPIEIKCIKCGRLVCLTHIGPVHGHSTLIKYWCISCNYHGEEEWVDKKPPLDILMGSALHQWAIEYNVSAHFAVPFH